ncbi:H-2 class I histocompatibility antigen, Q9 alpha chain-like [Pantherophis guttatus]|uniref:H-2 class I histocompatibility antigen, Q9 alpha chain-like n=1 Tax=Pantherophis guttatus TaxID=94885 RepID=A0A6P9CFB2_PANGU|nr:H-2 class I histocompatibility antigen, Q9 alpha chain-like [Pantherophis guttatus]
MALRSAPLWLLVLEVVALQHVCLGSSLHSLKHFITCTSEPSHGRPHYFVLGYVDDQVYVHYDSNSQRLQPRASWVEKIMKENLQLWDREAQNVRNYEALSRSKLEFLRTGYNQSKGFHTLQWMYGCELWGDGSKEGFLQYSYDGRTFITFDKETLTWVAHQPLAQIIKMKWDDSPGSNQEWKFYLEKDCIERLQKHLFYGKKMLLRTDSPVVTVSSKTETEDGMETHVCRIDGFYPKAIDASWTRDGKVWLQDTFHGTVVPNADGTYHYWLSIQIYSNDSDHYQCHVEHDSLQEPLDVALKAPKSNKGFIIGFIVAGFALACVIVGTLILFKKCRAKYQVSRRVPSTLEDRLTPSSL